MAIQQTTIYDLPYPDDDEVAKVPLHMGDLAKKVEESLELKANAADIKGTVITEGPTSAGIFRIVVADEPPASAANQTVVFLIKP